MSQAGRIPQCPFCDEPMYGYQIPDHVASEHDPFDATENRAETNAGEPTT